MSNNHKPSVFEMAGVLMNGTQSQIQAMRLRLSIGEDEVRKVQPGIKPPEPGKRRHHSGDESQ